MPGAVLSRWELSAGESCQEPGTWEARMKAQSPLEAGAAGRGEGPLFLSAQLLPSVSWAVHSGAALSRVGWRLLGEYRFWGTVGPLWWNLNPLGHRREGS